MIGNFNQKTFRLVGANLAIQYINTPHQLPYAAGYLTLIIHDFFFSFFRLPTLREHARQREHGSYFAGYFSPKDRNHEISDH